MAKKDKDKIKELGDQKLVAEIEKLQNQISLEQNLDQNTLDLSDDNYVQNKILKAKYTPYNGYTLFIYCKISVSISFMLIHGKSCFCFFISFSQQNHINCIPARSKAALLCFLHSPVTTGQCFE